MKTLREVRAWARKHKYTIYGDAGDSFEIAEGSQKRDPNAWWRPDALLYFSDCGSSYCCASPEFGSFDGTENDAEHWENLLTFYLRTAKHPFFRTTTTEEKRFSNINAALERVGFKKIRTIRSKHEGKYNVFIWEREPLEKGE